MSDVPHVLPDGWVLTTLAQLTQPSSEKIEPSKCGELPYVGLEHIESGTKRLLGHGHARDVRSTKSIFHRDDVLYGKLRPYLRKVWCAEFDGVCSTDILVYPQSEGVDSGFLAYLLSSEALTDHAVQSSAGINLPRVNASALGVAVVGLPPLPEQRRIVGKLDELFANRRAARVALGAVPMLLEQYRQSVTAAALRGDLTKDWRAQYPDVIPASQLLGVTHDRPDGSRPRRTVGARGVVTIDEALLAVLPSTWQYATVQDLIRTNILLGFADGNHGSLYPRKAQFGSAGVPFVTATQITGGRVDVSAAPRLDPGSARLLTKGWARGGDVLLTHNATVGRAARVDASEGDFLLGTSVTYYRPNAGLLCADYLYHVMVSPLWQDQLAQVMAQTTRDQVSIQKQAFFRIPLAPFEEQQEIARRLIKLLGWAARVEQLCRESSVELDTLETSTLAKALRGELVAQDPSDEPAAALLKRVKTPHGAAPVGRRARRATASV